MTPEELQALREKHRICVEKKWHCDVIKVLDAYEALIEYHDHDGDTDREDPWCRTCNTPYPCKIGLSLGHPYGVEV